MSSWDLAGLASKFTGLCAVAIVVGGGFSIWLDVHMGNPFRRRLLSYVLVGAIAGTVSACLFFLIQVGAINQAGVAGMWDWPMAKILATTGLGYATGLRVLGCVMAAGSAVVLSRSAHTIMRRRLGSVSIAALFTVQCALMVFSFPMMGHVANLGMLAQAALIVHVLSVFLWIGALYPLWQLCTADANATTHRTMVRFGEIAKFILIALIASGTYLIFELLSSFRELLDTAYGQSLLFKLIGVTGLIALAGLNKFLLVPDLQKGSAAVTRLRRSIQMEMLVALAILALTAYFTTAVGPPS